MEANKETVLTTKSGNKMTVADFQKWTKEQNRQWREDNGKIFSRCEKLIKSGRSEEDAFSEIMEIYSCGRQRIRNIYKRVLGSPSPGFRALSEATINLRVNRLSARADDSTDYNYELLEQLDKLESIGQKWLEVEETDDDGKIKTKKLPTQKIRKDLLDDNLKNEERILSAISKLLPTTVINQAFDNRSLTNQLSDEDLDNELEIISRGVGGRKKKD